MRTPHTNIKPQLPLSSIGLVMFLIFFALLSGAATALASTFAVFVFGGLVIGGIALVVPLHWLLIWLYIASFVITGQIMYFGGISKAGWIPFLIGLMLLIRFPIDVMQRNYISVDIRQKIPNAVRMMKLSIALFFATVLASTLINASPLLQILIISKEYLFLWGVYLVLAAGLLRPEVIERIWASLPWLMVLQFPLVLYQRFIVMPSRHDAGWDSVVGAFGGNPEGGGASGAMGFFCLIGISIAVSRWRAGLISRRKVLLLVFFGFLNIAFAEIKFMILLLPICFILLFATEIMRKPLQGILLVALGFILSLGILLAYKAQFSTSIQKRENSTEKYFENMFYGQTETFFLDARTRDMGRLAALVFWYRDHHLDDPASLLVGQGAGSSRITMTFIGEAQARHFERLARSSLIILLWETGLIGTIAYIAMLSFTYFALTRSARDVTRSADSRATLDSMAVAIVMLAASLPYNQDILSTHQIQLLLLSAMGYAATLRLSTSGAIDSRLTPRPNGRRFCM